MQHTIPGGQAWQNDMAIDSLSFRALIKRSGVFAMTKQRIVIKPVVTTYFVVGN